MDKYVCGPCGYVYDPAEGDSDGVLILAPLLKIFPKTGSAPSAAHPKTNLKKKRDTVPALPQIAGRSGNLVKHWTLLHLIANRRFHFPLKPVPAIQSFSRRFGWSVQAPTGSTPFGLPAWSPYGSKKYPAQPWPWFYAPGRPEFTECFLGSLSRRLWCRPSLRRMTISVYPPPDTTLQFTPAMDRKSATTTSSSGLWMVPAW